MSEVSIAEQGLTYIWACLMKYSGDTYLLLFFAAALIFLFFRREDRKRFLYPLFFLLLTVFNPVLVLIAGKLFSIESVYYRFFWMLPVTIVIAYAACLLIEKIRWTWLKPFAFAAACALIVLAGAPVTSVSSAVTLPQNSWKVPDDLLQATEIIHRDSTEENPKVFFDETLNMTARQYDASLYLSINRDKMLYRMGVRTSTKIDETKSNYKAQKALMDPIMFAEYVKPKKFIKALKRTKTDYLVVPDDMHLEDYMASVNCIAVGKTDHFTVYRNAGAFWNEATTD